MGCFERCCWLFLLSANKVMIMYWPFAATMNQSAFFLSFFVFVFSIGVANLLLMGAFRCTFDLSWMWVFMYDQGFLTNWKHRQFWRVRLFFLSLCFFIFSPTTSAILFAPDLIRVFRCTFDGLWLILFCWVFKFSIAMLLLCISIFFSYSTSCTSSPIFHLICSVV